MKKTSTQNEKVKQAKIPQTTPECYISDKEALNLPAPEDTSGDWHFFAVFFDTEDRVIELAGEGTISNTNHIYENYGIYECSNALRQRGLSFVGDKAYAANHYRAILDMIYYSLKRYGKVIALDGATEDWLDTQEQKKLLLEKAKEMIPYLSETEQKELSKWVEEEYKPGYRG